MAESFGPLHRHLKWARLTWSLGIRRPFFGHLTAIILSATLVVEFDNDQRRGADFEIAE